MVSQKKRCNALSPSKMALGIKVGRFLIGTEIFQFWPLGAEKMDIKVGYPMSKSMTK